MGQESGKTDVLSSPVIRCGDCDLETLLGLEWFRTNRGGAYSSSTVCGCNTRRYHGLLVGAANPPVGRVMALSTVMEQIVIGGKTYDLATNEFGDTFSPRGVSHLVEFRDEVAATFVYCVEGVTLTKWVLLSGRSNAVVIRYELQGPPATLLLRPFTALRDFHALRSADQPHEIGFDAVDAGVVVEDRMQSTPPLHLVSGQAEFQGDPQWWYRVLYRVELARGLEGSEDIYSPGIFVWDSSQQSSCEITASLGEPVEVDFSDAVSQKRRQREQLAAAVGKASPAAQQLAVATDAFIVRRSPGASILAGFPWFADWGRDAFIALPGLLLATKRFELAQKVFRTYIASLSDGMIPNRFDDLTAAAHYNSIDASLWFVLAAERYIEAGGDMDFWRDELFPACSRYVGYFIF